VSGKDYSRAAVAALTGVGGHLRGRYEGRGDQDGYDGDCGKHVGLGWIG
jgi:hypothetical protein